MGPVAIRSGWFSLSYLIFVVNVHLDHSTLFYFSLNSNPEPFKRGIKSWASNVDGSFDRAKPPSTRPGSKAGSSKSVITSKSTLVDNVIISRKAEVKPSPMLRALVYFKTRMKRSAQSMMQPSLAPSKGGAA